MKLSHLAQTLIGSEIVKLGNEIKDRIRSGEHIFNFTIGDFDSSLFPIPQELEDGIIDAYKHRFTTYPPAEGILELRQSVGSFIKEREGLNYRPSEVLIASGGRPLIYSLYRAIIDKGDKVVYAVPSWNNNHYVHFTEGQHVVVQTKEENNFMPTAAELIPLIKGASLLALCSPLNPTGTAFGKEELEKICDAVIAENKTRRADEKKLFVMYDQMYWTLTFAGTEHYNPVTLRPELREVTVFIDGISKVFAATGVRVGWALGPEIIMSKMKAILSHVGAWAPMAEQKATAKYLLQSDAISKYLVHFKSEIDYRLQNIYNGFKHLKSEGYNVDVVAPQGAIYLAIKIDLVGKTRAYGKLLSTQEDVSAYILSEAKLAVVPFFAFGSSLNSPWYRLSVGTCKKEEIEEMFGKLREALGKLS